MVAVDSCENVAVGRLIKKFIGQSLGGPLQAFVTYAFVLRQ